MPLNYRSEHKAVMLQLCEEYLPTRQSERKRVTAHFNASFPDEPPRTTESFFRKFSQLYRTKTPAADPRCPPEAREAKRIRRLIFEKAQKGTDSSDEEEADQFDADADANSESEELHEPQELDNEAGDEARDEESGDVEVAGEDVSEDVSHSDAAGESFVRARKKSGVGAGKKKSSNGDVNSSAILSGQSPKRKAAAASASPTAKRPFLAKRTEPDSDSSDSLKDFLAYQKQLLEDAANRWAEEAAERRRVDDMRFAMIMQQTNTMMAIMMNVMMAQAPNGHPFRNVMGMPFPTAGGAPPNVAAAGGPPPNVTAAAAAANPCDGPASDTKKKDKDAVTKAGLKDE